MESRGSFYVNQVHMVCSSVDAIFSFQRMGLVPGKSEAGSAVSTVQLCEELQISMSLPQMKVLLMLIYDQMLAAEAKIGAPIPLDKASQDRFDAALKLIREAE